MSDEVIRAYLYIVAQINSGFYFEPHDARMASLAFASYIQTCDQRAADDLLKIAINVGYKMREQHE